MQEFNQKKSKAAAQRAARLKLEADDLDEEAEQLCEMYEKEADQNRTLQFHIEM
jgi:hypothetical protein